MQVVEKKEMGIQFVFKGIFPVYPLSPVCRVCVWA